MKLNHFVSLSLAAALTVGAASAQETNELELLRKEIRELRARTQALEQKLERIEQKPAANLPAPPKEIVAAPVPVAKSWSPTDPLRLGKAGTYADLGLVATFAAGGSTANDIAGGTQLGGHDPNQRGFTVQGVEMNLQGAIDPFFRGNANIAFLLDSHGETGVELEEAWLETVSLPWNLQVRAGQILTEFGRINTQHPHSWAFVDVPLISGRLFGEDGLRNPGARFSWLVPTPFYSELFLSVQNSVGETAHSFVADSSPMTNVFTLPGGRPYATNVVSRGVSSLADLLFTPRYLASFDLTDSQTLVAGVSAAFGPNQTVAKGCAQIYGADFYWKWKSPNAHGGFPFVSLQAEAMLRRYDSESTFVHASGRQFTSRETYEDWGMYSQIAWGFKPGWVAALRGDYVAPVNRNSELTIPIVEFDRATRWRISPNLTWYPSEFSKLRLQYNYDNRDGFGVDHSVWLQFEFLLGAHAAHKF
ncbi:MAG: hypothetical protein EXS35_03835 [Pedosphaera sp.]|nr:hypothetical protein [Pedosphaera sp.]